MRIVLLHGDEVIRDRTFDDGPITIGSDASSGVHLPDLRIPLEHARLLTSATGQWHVQCTDSASATTVNGRAVDKRCPVFNGDEIGVGKFRLKVAVDTGCDLGVAGPSSLEELARIKDFPLPPGGEVRQADRPLAIPVDRQRYLVRFARELSDCTEIEGLMDLTLKVLRHVFKPGLVWFGARLQPAGPLGVMEGRGPEGVTSRPPQAQASIDYRCLERGQSLLLARKRSKNQECGIATPLEAVRGRLGVLYVEGNPDEHRFRAEHLDLLMALSAHVACRLEDILIEAVPARSAPTPPTPPPAQPSSDGQWLRELHDGLSPASLPRWAGCQVAVLRRPGANGGQDVYDLMTMPNGVASLLLASADGDATQRAITLAGARAACRVSGLHADPPRTLLRELNWLANEDRGSCTLAAVHVALNPKTGAIEFCTAGRIGALILEPQGAPRVLTDPKADRLGLGQPIDPPRRTETLRAGEMLVLSTPGCATLRDAAGTELGHDRLVEALCEQYGAPPAQMLEDVQHDLAGFFKDGSQPDDITVVLLYRP